MTLDHAVDVCRAVLEELDMVPWPLLEDDDGDVDGAEDAELVCFLEEAVLALWWTSGEAGVWRARGPGLVNTKDAKPRVQK